MTTSTFTPTTTCPAAINTPTPFTGASTVLLSTLVMLGDRNQVIEFNPDAALQKKIFTDSYVPNSAEFTLRSGTDRYVVQRAEHLGTGTVRIYYVRWGNWNSVRYVHASSAKSQLEQTLVATAEEEQVIEFNPGAALQRRIFADNYVPNSPEFIAQVNGIRYVAQRAEHLRTGNVRIYFVREGSWANVSFATK